MTQQQLSAAPGRPREFDVDEAIALAMEVFGTRGYNGTSLVDLLEGTGLSRGSLYKAFGDKQTLFLAALVRYTSDASARLSHTLQQAGPSKPLIRETLMRFARSSCGVEGLRGCLLVATATEMLPHDADAAQCVRALFEHMRHAYTEAIERGQAQGEISQRHDAQTLARLIVCLAQGMRTVGKAGAQEAEMQSVVDAAMALLD
jgi:TetR/AcrR family transcriptional repressor of nem operon